MTLLTKIVLNEDIFPRVDLDLMNNTHFEEIGMVKELGAFIVDYQQGDNLEAIEKNITASLDNWFQHTQIHFARENTLMKEIQFPMYLVHSGEHELVLENMSEMVASWKADNDIEVLADYVFTIWPTWFIDHVNSMDMITAQFAVMHGYDPHTQISE